MYIYIYIYIYARLSLYIYILSVAPIAARSLRLDRAITIADDRRRVLGHPIARFCCRGVCKWPARSQISPIAIAHPITS